MEIQHGDVSTVLREAENNEMLVRLYKLKRANGLVIYTVAMWGPMGFCGSVHHNRFKPANDTYNRKRQRWIWS